MGKASIWTSSPAVGTRAGLGGLWYGRQWRGNKIEIMGVKRKVFASKHMQRRKIKVKRWKEVSKGQGRNKPHAAMMRSPDKTAWQTVVHRKSNGALRKAGIPGYSELP